MIRGGIIMNFIIGMINNLTSKKFPPFILFFSRIPCSFFTIQLTGVIEWEKQGSQIYRGAMSNAAHWVCKGRPHIHSGLEIKGKIRIKYVKLLYLHLLFKNQMEKFLTKVVFISEPTLKQIFN